MYIYICVCIYIYTYIYICIYIVLLCIYIIYIIWYNILLDYIVSYHIISYYIYVYIVCVSEWSKSMGWWAPKSFPSLFPKPKTAVPEMVRFALWQSYAHRLGAGRVTWGSTLRCWCYKKTWRGCDQKDQDECHRRSQGAFHDFRLSLCSMWGSAACLRDTWNSGAILDVSSHVCSAVSWKKLPEEERYSHRCP